MNKVAVVIPCFRGKKSILSMIATIAEEVIKFMGWTMPVRKKPDLPT